MSIQTKIPLNPAFAAYEQMAADYDVFTDGYDHRTWLAAINTRAQQLGLSGHRALDLACGTGKSTAVLIEAGYAVQGCDISPAMIERARLRLPTHADALFVADMQTLPPLGAYDLILSLDDALNYVLDFSGLVQVFEGVARNLAPSGMCVFDLNTTTTYQTTFAQTWVRQGPGFFFAWQGRASPDMAPGSLANADLEAFTMGTDGMWARRTSRHLQRHHPRGEVEAALTDAGLVARAVVGQRSGCRLEDEADEAEHIKFVYFCQQVR